MLGAIIGDIVGSVYERQNIKTKDFPLFNDDCFFTDDTVMTIATAEAMMNGGETDDFIDAYKKWGRLYPNAGYGGRFFSWIHSDDREPYNSWGNGSAMRVSPCAWMMNCGFQVRAGFWPQDNWECVARSAGVTHNHPEGIKGANATAIAIVLSRSYVEAHTFGDPMQWSLGDLKAVMRKTIEAEFGYDLSRTLDEIRPTYRFDVSCQGTVPQAIIAFLESSDFEDAVRNAISLGGDSDTLAAITGSIAEAAYGVPDWIKDRALGYLDNPLREVYERWEKVIKQSEDFLKVREARQQESERIELKDIPLPCFDKLVLCDEKTSRVSVYVCAELAGGCLKIMGQDLGQAVQETFEVDEYEYFYDFDRENTARLFSLLGTADQKVEERFLEMFGGMDGCRALREFCDANGITYRFSTWY